MRLILSLVLCIAVGGCGLAYQQKRDELVKRSTATDWGVLDSNHQAAERVLISQMLKDPDSAKIRFAAPRRGTDDINGEQSLVWFSHAFVNAKNSFGGYTGEQSFAFEYMCNRKEDCKLIGYAVPNKDDPTELEWQREALEKERSNAVEDKIFQNKFDKHMALADIEIAEKSTLETLGYKNGMNCAVADDEVNGFVAFFCKQPVIFLMAVNQSPLVQEFFGEIENRKLEAIFIGGLNVMREPKNYILRNHPKGFAIYIELKDSPDIFNKISQEIRKKQRPIEVFFKSEKQSIKFLLSPK